MMTIATTAMTSFHGSPASFSSLSLQANICPGIHSLTPIILLAHPKPSKLWDPEASILGQKVHICNFKGLENSVCNYIYSLQEGPDCHKGAQTNLD